MAPHVLVIGDGGDVAPALRRSHRARTTTLCRVSALGRVTGAQDNARLFGLNSSAEEWMAVARLVHRLDPFVALGVYTELDQDRAAMIAEDLGLAFHKPAVIAAVYDKQLMRERLRARAVDDTPCAVAGSAAEVERLGQDVGYPLILKPVGGFASRGISLLRGAADIDGAFRWAMDDAGDGPGALLAERYHAGQEVSVEAFSEQGNHQILAVTEKFSSPDSFVEVGHVVPAPLPAARCREIEAYVGRVLDALGVTAGATHTELVLTGSGPRVIETHTRAAGDEIPELVRLVYGVNIAQLSAAATLGRQARIPPQPAALGTGAVWYFSPSSAGTITKVCGVEQVRDLPGVVNVDVKKGAGDHFDGWPLKSSLARAVSVRVHTGSREEALRLRDRISALLGFAVTADPPGSSRSGTGPKTAADKDC